MSLRASRVTGVRRALALVLLLAAAVAGMSRPRGRPRRTRHDHPRGEPVVIGHRGAAGLPARAHARLLQLAAAHGRRLHRARPRLDQGRRARRPPRERDQRHDRRRRPPGVRRPQDDEDDRRHQRSRAGSPRTSRSPSSRRCAPRSACPTCRQHNTLYDGRYQIPTFQEVIDLRKRLSRELHREIGIYPETKHPTYFRPIGLPLEEPLVQTLRANGLDTRRRDGLRPVLRDRATSSALNRPLQVPLVQLSTRRRAARRLRGRGRHADLRRPADARRPARRRRRTPTASAREGLIVPRDAAGQLLPPTTLVDDAHAAGLVVHPYTFRNENNFLPRGFRRGDRPRRATATRSPSSSCSSGSASTACSPTTPTRRSRRAASAEHSRPRDRRRVRRAGPRARAEPVDSDAGTSMSTSSQSRPPERTASRRRPSSRKPARRYDASAC